MYENDKRFGEGTYNYTDGRIVKSLWQDDKQVKKLKLIWPKIQRFEQDRGL